MTKFKLVLHGTYNPKSKKMKEGCKFVFQQKGKSTKQCTMLYSWDGGVLFQWTSDNWPLPDRLELHYK